MSIRTEQVSENVKITLGEVINKELEINEGEILTISNVSVSPDLKNARIYISVWPEEKSESILKHLIKNAKHLRHKLAQQIYMKAVPNLHFALQEEMSVEDEVSMLLDELKNKNESK